MLVILSDTHRSEGTGLVGAAEVAVDDAEIVLHLGDFTTDAVLDAFRDVAAEFRGVAGNRDGPSVVEGLPETTTVDYAGVRIAATHQNRSGRTGLTMFGRQRGADLVASGHSHRPAVDEAGEVTLLNPGSHADPRGARQSFAVLEPTAEGIDGRLLTIDGECFTEFTVEGAATD